MKAVAPPTHRLNVNVGSTNTTFLVAYAISLVAGFWVYDTLSATATLPTTDLGQWIMYSRYYLGDNIPTYRNAPAVSPLLPIILAFTTGLMKNSIHAVTFLSACFIFLLSLTVFFLTLALLRDNLAAVLAVAFVAFGQHILVYLTAFGGLPQLGALISMNIGFIAMARIASSVHGRNWWILLALSILSVSFFHVPSAPIFLASVAIILSILGISDQDYLVSGLQYLFVPASAFLLYFLIFHEEEIAYATNRAAAYRRGIGGLAEYFILDHWLVVLATIALLSLVLSAYSSLRYGSLHEKKMTAIMLVWFFAPVGFMFVSHFLGLGTDYHRFVFYFIQPPLVSLAYRVARSTRSVLIVLKGAEHKLADRSLLHIAASHKVHVVHIIILLSVLVVTENTIRFTSQFYSQSLRYYSVPHSLSLIDLIAWIVATGGDKALFMPSLAEANWVEGLSGRGTLFPNKFRFLYRQGEVDRVLTADMFATGADLSIENGFNYLQFRRNDNNEPRELAFAVAHQGEYTEYITLDDQLIVIEAIVDGVPRTFNFSDSFSQSGEPAIIVGQNTVQVTFDYVSTMSRTALRATKTVTVSSDSSAVTVEFTIGSNPNIDINQIGVRLSGPVERAGERTINQARIVRLAVKPDGARLYVRELHGSDVVTDIALSPVPLQIELLENSSLVHASAAYLQLMLPFDQEPETHFQVSITPQVDAQLREGLRVNRAGDLISAYDVGYLVFKNTDTQMQVELEGKGFTRVYSNWNFVVYRVP